MLVLQMANRCRQLLNYLGENTIPNIISLIILKPNFTHLFQVLLTQMFSLISTYSLVTARIAKKDQIDGTDKRDVG